MRIIFHGDNASSFSAGFAELVGPQADIRILPDVLASDADKRLFPRLRTTAPAGMAALASGFSDPRFRELAFRYRARNWPASLDADERGRARHGAHRHELHRRADAAARRRTGGACPLHELVPAERRHADRHR